MLLPMLSARTISIDLLGFDEVETKAIDAFLRLTQRRAITYVRRDPHGSETAALQLVSATDIAAVARVSTWLAAAKLRNQAAIVVGPAHTPLTTIGGIPVLSRPINWMRLAATMDEAIVQRQAAHDKGMAPDPTSAAATERPQIMVCDDNAVSALHAQRVIQEIGATVIVAADGKRAVEVATASPLQLIFLDVVMPGMDGFATCRAIRALPTRPAPRIVMLTSRDGTFDKVRGRLVGADAWLVKPLTVAAVAAQRALSAVSA
jgi:two-component system, cell cycle response regulator